MNQQVTAGEVEVDSHLATGALAGSLLRPGHGMGERMEAREKANDLIRPFMQK